MTGAVALRPHILQNAGENTRTPLQPGIAVRKNLWVVSPGVGHPAGLKAGRVQLTQQDGAPGRGRIDPGHPGHMDRFHHHDQVGTPQQWGVDLQRPVLLQSYAVRLRSGDRFGRRGSTAAQESGGYHARRTSRLRELERDEWTAADVAVAEYEDRFGNRA